MRCARRLTTRATRLDRSAVNADVMSRAVVKDRGHLARLSSMAHAMCGSRRSPTPVSSSLPMRSCHHPVVTSVCPPELAT